MREFPSELLLQSGEDKIKAFRDVFIMHGKLEQAITQTMQYVDAGAKERIILVCGPSDVGKKEYIRCLKESIEKHASESLDVGSIPFESIEAMPAFLEGGYDLTAFYKSALRKLKEPMIEYKIQNELVIKYDEDGSRMVVSRPRKADYFEAFTSTLHYRKCKVFVIDEAHHMMVQTNGQKLNRLVDIIKAVANQSNGTVIVLVGTYELLSLIEGLDGNRIDQLMSRIRIVDLSRYDTNKKPEATTFGNIAQGFINRMPLRRTSDDFLDKHWLKINACTNGCVGTLKKLLLDAYVSALSENADTLKEKHIDPRGSYQRDAKAKLITIIRGERRLATILTDISKPQEESDSPNELENSKQGNITMNRNPGDRNPHRDTVGQAK